MDKLPRWTKKEVSVKSLAGKAKRDRVFLSEILKGVASDQAQVKYKSAKVLRYLSETEPEVLYPYWDQFVKRLSSDNTFLRSDAMLVITNLLAVDLENRFEGILNRCYKQLNDESMICAANLAGISGKIALAKPHLQTRIINKLIKIDQTHHSTECKNIIKGKVIESFSQFYALADPSNKEKMIRFVRNEKDNPRGGTRKKATVFLKRWE